MSYSKSSISYCCYVIVNEWEIWLDNLFSLLKSTFSYHVGNKNLISNGIKEVTKYGYNKSLYLQTIEIDLHI